jgi:dopamine beta-monooxygenase
MYLLWSRGSEPIDTSSDYFATPNVSVHDQGMHMLQLLRADIIKVPERNLNQVDIQLDNVKIPAEETTYWCKVQKLGPAFKEKRHIVEVRENYTMPAKNFLQSLTKS